MNQNSSLETFLDDQVCVSQYVYPRPKGMHQPTEASLRKGVWEESVGYHNGTSRGGSFVVSRILTLENYVVITNKKLYIHITIRMGVKT